MKITILCVGKIKENYLKMGIEEYKKRLSRYCILEITEVLDEKVPDHINQNEIEKIKEKEGKRLEKYLKPNTYIIALDIKGAELDSVQFSDKIQKLGIEGKSSIIFIIGGSLGIASDILKQADFKLSFSKLTFPHQMMRMIVLEQIYRSYKIIKKEPYHK